MTLFKYSWRDIISGSSFFCVVFDFFLNISFTAENENLYLLDILLWINKTILLSSPTWLNTSKLTLFLPSSAFTLSKPTTSLLPSTSLPPPSSLSPSSPTLLLPLTIVSDLSTLPPSSVISPPPISSSFPLPISSPSSLTWTSVSPALSPSSSLYSFFYVLLSVLVMLGFFRNDLMKYGCFILLLNTVWFILMCFWKYFLV